MKKKTLQTLIVAAAVVFVAYLLVTNMPQNNANYEGGGGSGSASGGDNNYYYYDSNPSPAYTPAPDYDLPSSLHVTIEPNPVIMGNTVYGTVTSDGANYPVTVHAKHVGEGTEQTFGGRLDANGYFWHSETLAVPGYWDFWVTSDNGVSSNTPRLTVQGAMLTASRTFFSKTFALYDSHIELFCHSSGTATVFINTGSSSVPVGSVYINSGGFGEADLDLSSFFSLRSTGTYEMDFVVNGVKASDYGESITLTYGR